MKCVKCGKPNAKKRPNPWKVEMNNDHKPEWLCDGCYRTAKDEVQFLTQNCQQQAETTTGMLLFSQIRPFVENSDPLELS